MSKLLEARWIALDPQALEEITGGLLSVKIGTASGLIRTANGLAVSGVTNEMLAGSITLDKLVKGGVIALTDEQMTIQELWSFPDGAKTPEIAGSKIATENSITAALNNRDAKDSVKGVAEINLTLANDPGTIDGVTYNDGDRILLTAQTDLKENGIWLVSLSGSWIRPDDFAAGMPAAAAYTIVQRGTANAETLWVCSVNTGSDTIDTDPLSWVSFNSGGGGGTTPNAHEQDFDSTNLVAGVLTVDHGLGKKLVSVTVADENYEKIIPDSIQYVNPDSLTIDLSGFTVNGTWHLLVLKGIT